MNSPEATCSAPAREDIAVRSTDGLTAIQIKVAEDYLAFRRDADAQPAVAATLTQAIQTYELRNAVEGLTGLLREWTRNPQKAVTYFRQFSAIMENIDEAAAKIEKFHADEQFEANLKAMRDQLPPLEGGA